VINICKKSNKINNKKYKISIIIPCRNEEKYISRCIESIIKQTYPTDKVEILIIDGMSEDNTRGVIEKYTKRYSYIKLIDNPRRIVPTALNIGIKRAMGEIIIRIDVHSSYPCNYVEKIILWIEKSKADNVGGILIVKPGSETVIAMAIASVLSHPFGVGNALFRTGIKNPQYVDTVPLGAYKRVIFDKIGFFDEDLVRNQDDEFNLRLIKNGGKILLVPDIFSYRYARNSLGKLWRMYFQYGYFKPLLSVIVIIFC